MEPTNERDHVGLKYNKMKYEQAQRGHYQFLPIGCSRVPGGGGGRKNEAEKWFSPFIIDLDTYRNGWIVLEIFFLFLFFTTVQGLWVLSCEFTNLIKSDQCVEKSFGLDSQIHRVIYSNLTGKNMLWDLGQTLKTYIDKWLKTGSK